MKSNTVHTLSKLFEIFEALLKMSVGILLLPDMKGASWSTSTNVEENGPDCRIQSQQTGLRP